MACSGVKNLNSVYNCTYCKIGNVVEITVDFANINVSSSGIVLGTLPESYRPLIATYARNCFDNQNGELLVYPNGTVKISSSTGAFLYMHATSSFPAASGFGI